MSTTNHKVILLSRKGKSNGAANGYKSVFVDARKKVVEVEINCVLLGREAESVGELLRTFLRDEVTAGEDTAYPNLHALLEALEEEGVV